MWTKTMISVRTKKRKMSDAIRFDKNNQKKTIRLTVGAPFEKNQARSYTTQKENLGSGNDDARD